MAARKSTVRTTKQPTRRAKLNGFAVNLTADEIYAIQEFAERESGDALERISRAAVADAVYPADREAVVREIRDLVDTCAGLAAKMAPLVDQIYVRIPAMADSESGDGGQRRSEATQVGGLSLRVSGMGVGGAVLAQ